MEPGAGSTPYFNSAVTNTAVAVTAYPTRVFYVHCVNNTLTDVFLQVYDRAAADVVVGTTVPTQSWIIPGGSGASNRGAFEEALSWPLQFFTALSIAATTTPTGNTAPSTAATVNLGYK